VTGKFVDIARDDRFHDVNRSRAAVAGQRVSPAVILAGGVSPNKRAMEHMSISRPSCGLVGVARR